MGQALLFKSLKSGACINVECICKLNNTVLSFCVGFNPESSQNENFTQVIQYQ